MFKRIIVLGVILGIFAVPATASAAGIDENYPKEIATGQPITITFVPDSGVTYQLTWTTVDIGTREEGPAQNTTCSTDAPSGCSVTESYSNPGIKNVDAYLNGDPSNAYRAQFRVVRAEDLPAPVDVSGPQDMVLPQDQMMVTTPKTHVAVSWDMGVAAGQADTKLVSQQNGLNTFAVTFYAPPGNMKVTILANNPGSNRGDQAEVMRHVVAYRGSWFVFLAPRLADYRVSRNSLRLLAFARYVARRTTHWNEVIKIQHRPDKSWKTDWFQAGGGKSYDGQARYSVGEYGIAFSPGSQVWRLIRTRICSGGPMRAIAVYTITYRQKYRKDHRTRYRTKRLARKTMNLPIPASICTS